MSETQDPRRPEQDPGTGSTEPGYGYAAPPPPMGQQTPPGVGQPADLMPRFLARLIDYVILFVVNMVLVFFIVAGVLLGSGGGMMGFGSGTNFVVSLITSLLTAAIALGYFALLESSRGQTVGKMALKLETRGPDGGRPTMEQALRRNAFTALGVLGIIPIFGGFLAFAAQLAAVIAIAVTINNNRMTRRGWHDDFAGGTIVVKVG